MTNHIWRIEVNLSPNSWHHVPSQENPSGITSRGLFASQINNSLWWAGPHWLKQTFDKSCQQAKYGTYPIETKLNTTSTVTKYFQNNHLDTFTLEQNRFLTIIVLRHINITIIISKNILQYAKINEEFFKNKETVC